MPRLPQPGNVINGYTITRHINTGAMANAFAATAPDGTTVFFKQYKSPSVAVPWFKKFVAYNRELNQRVEAPTLQRFCVRNITSFEATFGVLTFFQVFEFIEGGHDLGTILESASKRPKKLAWDQRLIMARVIMAAIAELHAKKVIHGDLKPPNIQMIEDPTIKVRYQPKLIDMDRSILVDRRAPWDGLESYVGTPRYFSPEHLDARIPETASDVFTCGIILYELLGQGHPYDGLDEAGYRAAVLKGSAPQPELQGELADERATTVLVETLHRCLSRNAVARPSALQVAHALNGTATTPTPVPTLPKKPAAPPETRRPPETPKTPETPKAGANTLLLKAEGGTGQLRLNVRTSFGKHLLKIFGEDGARADEQQFVLEPRHDEWWIEPVAGSHAWTTVNGAHLEKPQKLKNGDVIALQGRKSGKTILPVVTNYPA